MGTNDFGYVYDPIGSRRTATNDSQALTYLAKWWRQIDGRTKSSVSEAVKAH